MRRIRKTNIINMMAKEVEITGAEVNAAKLKALQATIDKIEKD